MKVGFDISQIAHGGGVGIYTQKLAEELIKISELEMYFFYSSLRKPYSGSLPNVKSFRLPPTLFEVLFNRIRNIPIDRFIGEVDIFHSSDWVQPPTKAKKITTYHDLVPLLYPQWSYPKIVSVQKRRLKIVEREIDMVICVSESTKRDLIKISKIPEERIVVIYEGVAPIFRVQDKERIEKFRRKYNLPNNFVLAIGGIGERRNLKRVKEALKGLDLVVTGETFPWLPYSELPLLYNAANCLVYPSLYEGFGLPLLEAMACGVPVVTSNISSMPEIGGEAVLYVDPLDFKDIRKKIDQIIEDQSLRRDLISKGLKRVKEFSWEKCAKETVKVYKRVLDEN